MHIPPGICMCVCRYVGMHIPPGTISSVWIFFSPCNHFINTKKIFFFFRRRKTERNFPPFFFTSQESSTYTPPLSSLSAHPIRPSLTLRPPVHPYLAHPSTHSSPLRPPIESKTLGVAQGRELRYGRRDGHKGGV